MNQPPAKLMVAVYDRTVCVKVNGRADFTSSLDLKKLISELWQRGYSHFIFELCDCLSMDSTFLGLLSGIGLKLSGGKSVQLGAPLELLNPNPRIAETLENLGVTGLFAIRTCAEPASNKFEPLAKAPNNTQMELTRTCLEAHETLMAIKPENIQKFKDVAQFLADDLKRLEAAGG
ncbi:MAG: STAS domain-containing protein [Limisphaerales bacterium]